MSDDGRDKEDAGTTDTGESDAVDGGEERSKRARATVELDVDQIVEESVISPGPPSPPQPPAPSPAPATAPETGRQVYEVTKQPVPWHKLDYREATLISKVSGRSREEAIHLSGLGPKTGAELFESLVERGLIRVHHRSSP